MSETQTQEIPPRSGTAFMLRRGQVLTIIDPTGLQVADLLAFNAEDHGETFSNGRTFDYANHIYLTTGDVIYSNRSNKIFTIVDDTVRRHDFLFTPCSKDTFRLKFGHAKPHHGCFGNFSQALQPHGINDDQITIPFNCFMNVRVGEDGSISVQPPLSKAGDHIDLIAEMDLLVGLTACSAGRSNAGEFKPIHYQIH